MQFIAASLGVECNFCHVEGAFEKDDKEPKATARKMMLMMFAINQNNFDNQRKVTCYSCHRGAPKPVSVPPVTLEGRAWLSDQSESAGTHLSSELPGIDEVLARYSKAVNGALRNGAASARSARGVATLPGGQQIPVEILSKPPDKRLLIMHLSNGDSVTAYDGQTGWLEFPGRGPLRMNSTETEAARLDAVLHNSADLKPLFKESKVVKVVNVGQQDSYLVLGIPAEGPTVEMYFAKESGLLLRVVRYADSALGLNPTQIDYEDYRALGDLKIPYRWTVARPLGGFTVQIQETQQNIPIDDDMFSEPKQASTPARPLAKSDPLVLALGDPVLNRNLE
jgi:hypothetical protein